MTKNKLISDIILRITKSKPADDLELEPKQVAFWLSLVIESMVKDNLDGALESGQRVPDFYVLKEGFKTIYSESYSVVDEEDERLYVELNKPAMSLLNDSAIIRVITNEGSRFDKTRLSTVDFTEDMEFSKASTKNLVYYRDGKKKLVLLGVPRELIDVIKIMVWYVPQADIECFDDDEELPIPQDMLEEVQMRVEEMAKRQMYGAADVENDGEDDLPNVI